MTEDTTSDTNRMTLRLPPDLADAIDARAKEVGLSRTAWIERATRWVIQSLPTRADPVTAHKAALAAPKEVTGTEATKADMGLETVDGKPAGKATKP